MSKNYFFFFYSFLLISFFHLTFSQGDLFQERSRKSQDDLMKHIGVLDELLTKLNQYPSVLNRPRFGKRAWGDDLGHLISLVTDIRGSLKRLQEDMNDRK